MNISELLNGAMGQQIVQGISNRTNTTHEETASVVRTAAPALLAMLQKNASTPAGANGILQALTKHDGSVFNNLSGFLSSGDTSDGNKILGHILHGQNATMETAVSQQTGVSSSKVSDILAMLAPIVMGFLGKESKSAAAQQGSGGLGGILGGLLGGGSGGDLFTSFLDQDGDGKLTMKDAAAAFSKNKSGGGGLGDMLGGLLGKK